MTGTRSATGVPTRVWFNKTFSSVRTVVARLRDGDREQRYHVTVSTAQPHTATTATAHAAVLEPAGLAGEAYLDWCAGFCAERGIDLFVPGKEAVRIAAAHARFAAIGTRVLSVASAEVLALLHDKARCYADALDHALPPAEFRVVEHLDALLAAYRELRARHAQVCIKPACSVYGLGFRIIDESRCVIEHIAEGSEHRVGLADLHACLPAAPAFRPLLVMEYLDGHEYSVDAVADRGRLIVAVPRRKPLGGEPGQRIDPRADLLDEVAFLTRKYGLNGLFNVQFREGRGGLRLLEINPRAAGGIGMACLAGPNLPYLAIAGADRGFAGLAVPPVQADLRVGEINEARVLG